MKWYHKVDPEWLAERKKYITATDIQKLLPTTPTGKARVNLEETYLKVWADKQCLISEDDVCSSGPMARGHLLEPYAIAEFNKLGITSELFHWDDALVYTGAVSCSPDSLSTPQVKGGVRHHGSKVEATFMGEVKSYKAADHYRIGLAADKMSLDERWQIATAFYTIPTLEISALIMFNPSARHPLFYHLYERSEMCVELDAIAVIEKLYLASVAGFNAAAGIKCSHFVAGSCITEDEIIAQLEAEADIQSGLNP